MENLCFGTIVCPEARFRLHEASKINKIMLIFVESQEIHPRAPNSGFHTVYAMENQWFGTILCAEPDSVPMRARGYQILWIFV